MRFQGVALSFVLCLSQTRLFFSIILFYFALTASYLQLRQQPHESSQGERTHTALIGLAVIVPHALGGPLDGEWCLSLPLHVNIAMIKCSRIQTFLIKQLDIVTVLVLIFRDRDYTVQAASRSTKHRTRPSEKKISRLKKQEKKEK